VDRDAREPALRRGRRSALLEELHEHLLADLLGLVGVGEEEAAERAHPPLLSAVERIVVELAARGRLHLPCPSALRRPDEATPAMVDSSGPSLRRGGRRGKCKGMEPALARALAALTTGIYVLTVRDGDRRHGMSSSWVTQVSGDPPLLMASVDRRHFTHDILARSGRFALNVVGERGRRLEDYFYSAASRRPDNLDAVAWDDAPDGLAAIVLITALAYLPIFRGGFIWDDETLITENRLLRTLGGLRAIWLEPARSPQYDPLGRLGGGAEERPGGPLLSPGPPPLSPLRPRAALGGALRPGLRRLRARGPQQDCCVYEHYEKALALEPALKQARENLNAVRAQQHGAP